MAQTQNIQENESLNLDEKITVRSIAGWNTGFARRVDGYGDVSIPPNGTTRLTRSEVIAQVQGGNRLFAGTDGKGSHATLVIEDTPTRIEVGFEPEDGSVQQLVFSETKLKELLKVRSLNSFSKQFEDYIVTRAEKLAAMNAIQKMKFNDYDKIRFIESYTGYKMQTT